MLWILVVFTSISVTLGNSQKYSPEGCMNQGYNGSTCTIICPAKDACNFNMIKLPRDSAIDTVIIRCAPKQSGESTCKDKLSLGNPDVSVYLICLNGGCEDVNEVNRRFSYIYCAPALDCKDVQNKYSEVKVMNGIKVVVFNDKVTVGADIDNNEAVGTIFTQLPLNRNPRS